MTGQTVRGAVAEREAQKSIAYGDLKAARDWFATAVPSHVDPDNFLAVLLGLLTRNDKLREAAEGNPVSMMVAAAECARLGLVPGDTYHFVPFYNSKQRKLEVTGIIDYKGEIDLIYRAGGVESVHAEVVRERDKFLFRPGMRLPEHEIMPNAAGQIGLSDDKERGILTGVYAYARLRGGGLSQVVVMSQATVAKHRAMAKTFEMWGPEWPEETEWTENMWLKTALHGLPKWVPTSPEYVGELWRAAVAVTKPDTPAALLVPDRPALMPPTPGPSGEGNGQTVRGAISAARGGAKASAATRQAPGSDRTKGYRTMHAVFRDASMGGDANRDAQLAVLRVLLRPVQEAEPGPQNLAVIESMATLTDEELGVASVKMMQMTKGTKTDELKAGMLALARAGGFEGELHG